MAELRARLPGYAVPRYVRETRAGRARKCWPRIGELMRFFCGKDEIQTVILTGTCGAAWLGENLAGICAGEYPSSLTQDDRLLRSG